MPFIKVTHVCMIFDNNLIEQSHETLHLFDNSTSEKKEILSGTLQIVGVHKFE